ncbi:ATP-binding cassette sub-family C member Sur-like [Chelonus insularis]|uniref:ATP-binding cassette sub-family C member Sur-like n=1 Tax=Chelonus insularis TaxID=460826 RepID=UPI00158BFCED|nr:ATP-binding cassette sub-family C member Sur-like [Chelonus insularis]
MMGLCKKTAFLRLLPTSGWHLVWTWDTDNGTTIKMTSSASSRFDCFVEVVNLAVVILALIAALCIIVKYKFTDQRMCTTNLLPCHNLRSVLCILLLLVLLLEFSEALIDQAPVSQSISLLAVIFCWILHRETEMRDGLGLAVSGGAFITIAVARLWRLFHLIRFDLTIRHVRMISTIGTSLLCGLLALVDSYALYRLMERSKRYDVQASGNTRVSYRHACSVLLSKLTFHWVVDLLCRGYRAPLDFNDLGELPEEESTIIQFEKFKKIYEEQRYAHLDDKPSLWSCYWKQVWPAFLVGGILKFFGDATTLIGPLAISKIVNYVEVMQNSTESGEKKFKNYITLQELLENGYFLGLLVFLAVILQSTLSQASTHFLNVEGIRLRTALQALIYHKSLRLYSWTIIEEEETSGKENDKDNHRSHVADIGTLTNLMAEDAYNVMSFFWIGHYTWAIPLKIIAIIFLLYMKLGISAIIGAVCCILIVTPLQLFLGKKMSDNLKSIAERSDARLKLLNEILQGMRLVKLRAWEVVFEKKIQRTREEELSLLNKDSIYWGLITFLTHASSVLMTLFTFGVYFWVEQTHLDAGNVFASLALFSQLTVPLFIFPVIIPIILNARISTKRLEDFLSLPEVINVLPDPRVNRRIDENDEHRTSEISICESHIEERTSVKIPTFGTLGNINEDDEDLRGLHILGTYDTSSSSDTVFEKDPEPSMKPALLHITGVFSLGSDDAHLIIDDLIIPRGKLTLIVGKTGSGKTSLISAMLSEVLKLQGKIEWAKDSQVAYVSQKPWLLNTTLRENIIFGSTYNRIRYRCVLKACALQPDIDILPGKDMTRIGEKGINLSGGQKQRIAIARAVYSDADTVILDDPLSALDQAVGQQIFDQAIQKLLLRRGRTVVMVTHRLELLRAAHQVIVTEDCRIRAVGTLTSIELTDPALIEEWKETARRRLDIAGGPRTAKERWSLVRLVSRIAGISMKHRHASDGSWITDADAHVSPPTFVPLRLRKSMMSGSRYLAHDLTDLPVAVDEWGVVRKRHKKHRVAARATSLQPPKHPPPVLRQSSTPTILETHYIAPRKRHHTLDSGQNTNVLKQFFSSKIINLASDETANKERKVLKRLMSSSSNKTSPQEWEHHPIKRLLSTESGITEDFDEDKCTECQDSQVSDPDEDASGLVTAAVWMDYLKAGGFTPGLIYLVAALGCQALRVFTDLWLSQWTNLGSHQLNNQEKTVFYFRIYIILSIFSIFLAALNSAAGQWAGTSARKNIHQGAIASILRAPLIFFEQTPVGRVLNRFSADMGVIDKKLSTSFQRLTSFILLCGSAIIVNVIISPWFLTAAIPTCLAYFFLQRFYRISARELQRIEGSTRGPVAAHFSETLTGLPVIRASKQQERFMDDMIEYLNANTNAFLILNTSSRWLGIALDYLGAVVVFASIFAALLSAELYPERVTPALVGLAVNYTFLVPIYLNWVVKFVSEIEMYMGSVARLTSYAEMPRENYRENGYVAEETWPEKGEIIFENVSLRYHPDCEPVVKDLNLRIPAGQKLGICGRTASGKSSTVMALFQLLEVSQGRILIDGIDLKRVSLLSLRSRLSAIPQDVIMFSGTIRENLDPLAEHTDDELWTALKLTQMKDVISSHPEGLDLEVREGGENFSAGQLQLLSMARATLRDSAVVILDEATSALDSSTEKYLLKEVSSTFKDKTVITIAHRVASLLYCDKVIVFSEGKIIEEGSPHELSQRPLGFFAEMLKTFDYSMSRLSSSDASVSEDRMRFSCFPRASILGQRGSINFSPVPGYEETSSVTGISIISNGDGREPIPMSYKRAGDLDDNGMIRQFSSSATLNGSGPLNVYTPTSKKNGRKPEQGLMRSDTIESDISQQGLKIPRGGVIGRTPTPPSAPTPIYEKDARSRKQIKRAILENEFLGNLEEAQVEALVSAMYPKAIPPNTLVIHEGDIGSHFYVSAEGEFDIYEGSKFQRSFGPGVAFGELALLYNTKRLRSISVKKGGKVWVLDRSVFLTVMMRSAQDRLEGNLRFLRKVSVLQKLPEPKEHVLAKISDLIRVEFFPAGAKILRQGEKGDKFFIISGGNVRITKDTEYGGEEELVVLGKGQYFGEKALYDKEDNRRQANAIALAPGVECLTLDGTSFLNYLGGLDEIRNKDWLAEYEKQKRSLTPKLWTNEYSDVTLYDLESRGTLGVGGFGRVELVTLRADPDKSFALKKLKKKTMVDQQQQEHVLNEKCIMQACDSPFICKLYQTYKDSKYVYFLMEVCLGGDVWTTLQKRRYFDDTTAQFMVGCVVEALDHLHSLNIVYRDLKPENLMLDSRGYLKLVDFGFSKKIGPDKTWTFAGTPEYVAPEIILNKGHDRAVDYWALGILTHELLVGKPPFRGSDHMTTYNKILKGIEMVGIPAIVNKNANHLIKKLLRLSPSERLGYQRNGIQDIRDHKWFTNFNWQALQRLALPAPIVPTVRNQTDTRNFERYPPEREVPPDEFSGWDMDF